MARTVTEADCAKPPPASTRPRILLAEDDDELRIALTAMLRGDGAEVVGVSSGRALEAELWRTTGQENPYTLVITDEHMPGGYGSSALRWARRHGWRIPFMLISGFDDDDLNRKAASLRAFLLTKPLDADQLRGLARWSTSEPRSEAPVCAWCRSPRDVMLGRSTTPSFPCKECNQADAAFEVELSRLRWT